MKREKNSSVPTKKLFNAWRNSASNSRSLFPHDSEQSLEKMLLILTNLNKLSLKRYVRTSPPSIVHVKRQMDSIKYFFLFIVLITVDGVTKGGQAVEEKGIVIRKMKE